MPSSRRKAQDQDLVEEFLARSSDSSFRQQLINDKPRMERLIDAAITKDVPFVVHLLAQDLSAAPVESLANSVETRHAGQPPVTDGSIAQSSKLEHLLVESNAPLPTAEMETAWRHYASHDHPPSRSDRLMLLDVVLRAVDSPPLRSVVNGALALLHSRYHGQAHNPLHDRWAILSQVAEHAVQTDSLEHATRAIAAMYQGRRPPTLAEIQLASKVIGLGCDRLAEAILPDQRMPILQRLDELVLMILPRWSRAFGKEVHDLRLKPLLERLDRILAKHEELEFRTKLFRRWHREIEWMPTTTVLNLLQHLSGGVRDPSKELIPARPRLLASLAGDLYRRWSKRAPQQLVEWTSHDCCEWLDCLTSTPAATPLTWDTARHFYFLFRKWSDEGLLREPFVARGRTVLNLIERSVPPDSNATKVAKAVLNDYIATAVQLHHQEGSGRRNMELPHWHLNVIAHAYLCLGDYKSVTEVYQRLLAQRMIPNKRDVSFLLGAAAERDTGLLRRMLGHVKTLGIILDRTATHAIIDGFLRQHMKLSALRRSLEMTARALEELDLVTPSTLAQFRTESEKVVEKSQRFHPYATQDPDQLFIRPTRHDSEGKARPVRPDHRHVARYLRASKKKKWDSALGMTKYALENKLFDGSFVEMTLRTVDHVYGRRPDQRAKMRQPLKDLLDLVMADPDDLLYRDKTVSLVRDLARNYQFDDVEQKLERWLESQA